jgi:class 3 adenylate cyclase
MPGHSYAPSLESLDHNYKDETFSISNMNSVSSTPRSASRSLSIRITTHIAPQVTVLCIDIKGFTATCAAMPASSVGEWVSSFYERVDRVAASHGISKVEVRGDCCICVSGVEGSVPSPAMAAAAADRIADQATRMLAFAAALHADLAALPLGSSGAPTTTAVRMGMATGEAAFLVGCPVSPDAAPFASTQGDVVALAMRMEALATPGAVHVHRSTALKWAAEARSPPPPTAAVECEGRGPQRAAVYDCAARAFRPDGGRPAAPRALGKRASALF